jgi:hypothetical protein
MLLYMPYPPVFLILSIAHSQQKIPRNETGYLNAYKNEMLNLDSKQGSV